MKPFGCWTILVRTPRSWRRLATNTVILILFGGCLMATLSPQNKMATHSTPQENKMAMHSLQENMMATHSLQEDMMATHSLQENMMATPSLQESTGSQQLPMTELVLDRDTGEYGGIVYVRKAVDLLPFEKKAQRMAPRYPASFMNSIRPSDFPYVMNTTAEEQERAAINGVDIEGLLEEVLLQHVIKSFTVPTFRCRRMVRVGGSYCARRPDAEKVICFDPPLLPESGQCLAYSFGVGHEMSFDKAIAQYGCNVFSFDADYGHLKYPRNPYPDVTFLKVRLGWSRLVTVLTDPSGRFPFVYRPLDDLMRNLGHDGATIDILKIDIENSEWDVFEKSIFKTSILQRTKQLALEVHLDFLYPDTQFDPHPDGRYEGLKQHARFLQGLHDRGFRLAYYEPNYNSPINTTLFGNTFHVYFETVWLNTALQPGRATEPTPDLAQFDEMPDVEIIHHAKPIKMSNAS